MLVSWFAEFLFYFVWNIKHIVCPVIRISSVPPDMWHNMLTVIDHFFYLAKVHHGRLVAQVWEERLDLWKLRHRNLIVILLSVWIMILVVRRSWFVKAVGWELGSFHPILLLIIPAVLFIIKLWELITAWVCAQGSWYLHFGILIASTAVFNCHSCLFIWWSNPIKSWIITVFSTSCNFLFGWAQQFFIWSEFTWINTKLLAIVSLSVDPRF